jgi:hypothetical protein
VKLFWKFRFRYSNVAGEFASREPDRNGDVAFHHALRRISNSQCFGCLLGHTLVFLTKTPLLADPKIAAKRMGRSELERVNLSQPYVVSIHCLVALIVAVGNCRAASSLSPSESVKMLAYKQISCNSFV